MIEETNKLDDLDKLRVYLHWYIIGLEIKYTHGLDEILHAQSFEYFKSPERIVTTDNGKDYAEKGIAKRFRTEASGIYRHYNTFKNEIFK